MDDLRILVRTASMVGMEVLTFNRSVQVNADV